MKKNLLFVITCLLVACSNHTEDLTSVENAISPNPQKKERTSIDVNSMGHSSPVELYGIYENDPENIIHYAVARLLAESELMAGANMALSLEEYAHGDWYLTTFPKIVYDYDNTPKYYEFGYVYDNQIVATITTYAKKEIDGVIAYIFPEPLNYDRPDLDFYVGNYPDRYYGTGGVCYLKNYDEELTEELTPIGTEEDQRNAMLEQMSDEDTMGIYEDMNEFGEDLNDVIVERDEYWNLVDAFVDENLGELLTTMDPPIREVRLNLDAFVNGNYEPITEEYLIKTILELMSCEIGHYSPYVLPGYSNALQKTHWEGFCGPSACAWIYRGIYSSYNGMYLPVFGDGDISDRYYFENYDYSVYSYYGVESSSSLSGAAAKQNYINRSIDSDNGLAACFYQETVPTLSHGEWQFPLYHSGMNRGFRAATQDEYRIKFTTTPYNWIRDRRQPVIIAINCSHYIAAFGIGNTFKRNGQIKDRYFKVTDNGYTTSSRGYKPYFRKKNGWNLHYGLTQS